MMTTRHLKTLQKFLRSSAHFTFVLAILFTTVACQKRCQQSSSTVFRSITETQWRLVQTNDPQIVSNGLDNFNFVIMQFTANYTGVVNRVVNNEMYETPISTIYYVPDVKTKRLRIQYSSVATTGSTGQVQQGDLGTFDYRYTLGRELEMNDEKNGYYYRYVPFTGVVNPDTDCTF